jgi:hypothetical protein
MNRTALITILVLLILLLAVAGWTADAIHAFGRAVGLKRDRSA